MENLIVIMSFILAVIFVVVNGSTQIFYAMSLGYKLKPTSLAYIVGAISNFITGNIVPISGQAETLTMSGFIKNINVRIGALIIASIVGIILGLTKSISTFVEFAGTTIIYGMMAGVGLILAEVALKLCKQELRTGVISITTATLVWIISHDVVYTIASSVLISTIDFSLIQKKTINLYQYSKLEIETEEWRFWRKNFWKDFKLIKPQFNFSAIIAALGFICLNIGSNISFGNITSNMAGVEPNIDLLTIINSVADIPSVMFGGMPIEAIISGTAAAPFPLYAGIAMMITAVLLLTGLMSKIGKYVPSQSISGFLLIIGFALTLVPNLVLVSNSESPLEGIIAAAITMITKNPFLGLLSGVIVKLMGTFMWVV